MIQSTRPSSRVRSFGPPLLAMAVLLAIAGPAWGQVGVNIQVTQGTLHQLFGSENTTNRGPVHEPIAVLVSNNGTAATAGPIDVEMQLNLPVPAGSYPQGVFTGCNAALSGTIRPAYGPMCVAMENADAGNIGPPGTVQSGSIYFHTRKTVRIEPLLAGKHRLVYFMLYFNNTGGTNIDRPWGPGNNYFQFTATATQVSPSVFSPTTYTPSPILLDIYQLQNRNHATAISCAGVAAPGPVTVIPGQFFSCDMVGDENDNVAVRFWAEFPGWNFKFFEIGAAWPVDAGKKDSAPFPNSVFPLPYIFYVNNLYSTGAPNTPRTGDWRFDLPAWTPRVPPQGPTALNHDYYPSPDAYPVGASGNVYQRMWLQAIGCTDPATATAPPQFHTRGCRIRIPLFALDNSGASLHYNDSATYIDIDIPPTPTAVRMGEMSATRGDEGVSIKWKTGHEVDNLGFRVYRETDGVRQQITPELLAGSALLFSSSMSLESGSTYRFVDRTAPATALYWIEEVPVSGPSAWHGPISFTAGARASRARVQSHEDDTPVTPYVGDVFRPIVPHLDNEGFGAPTFAAYGGGSAEELPSGSGMAALAAPGSPDQNRQFALAAAPGMKVLVSKEGWYRFTRSDLAAAGWDPGTSPANLQLYAEGKPIRMLVTSLPGGSYSMEFYGTGIDTTVTGTRAYWLAASSSPGERIVSVMGGPGSSAGDDFPYSVERKDRVLAVVGLVNPDAGVWFGPVVGPAPGYPPADQSVTVSNLNAFSARPATLEVSLQGGGAAYPGTPHTVDIFVNGNMLGPITFNGQASVTSSFELPASWLVNGQNAIKLSSRGASDYSAIDNVRLTYPHLYVADSGALAFTTGRGTAVTVAGFGSANVRAFDVTDPTRVSSVAVKLTQGKSWSATVSLPGNPGSRRVLAIEEGSRILKPDGFVPNAPSTLNKVNNAADLVIVSNPAFLQALGPLKALRQSQGLKTEIVDVTDVYDEFGYGVKSPEAIKSFVRNARSSWKTAPRYLLLVGDGSLDPRNYGQRPASAYSDFVPVRLVQTLALKTASDDWYVDLDDDSQPELAVGRLPVNTLAGAQTVVNKIVGYDQGSASSNVLLVVDRNDENDFEKTADGLAKLVSGKSVQEVRVGQVGNAAAASQVVAGFNAGPSLVDYVGHGQLTYWSKANIFGDDDVALLTNSWQLPLVVNMDCYNGYFHEPSGPSLAEALLSAPNGGAAAVWASSGFTYHLEQVPANEVLLKSLFSTSAPRIGDAMVSAKAATSSPDVRKTWNLMGDPSMKFK